jgi:hypothetical protein
MEALSLNLTERRVVWDGETYTFEEYVDFYGFQSALTRWQTNSAEQPVDTIVGHPESRAEQPGDINSAAQPVDLTASSVSSVVMARKPPSIEDCCKCGITFTDVKNTKKRHRYVYCCEACRRDEEDTNGHPFHTPNCYARRTTRVASDTIYVTSIIINHIQNGSACSNGDRDVCGVNNSIAGTGGGGVSGVLESMTPMQLAFPSFSLFPKWLRAGSVCSYVDWLTCRYDMAIPRDAKNDWEEFDTDLCQNNRFVICRTRKVQLLAFRQADLPSEFADRYFDVANAGLDGKCNDKYNLQDVTGLDFRVQAKVVSQALTVSILRYAIREIETRGLDSFAFVCHGATHRSVACCVLLAAICYPCAAISMTTPRTRLAAKKLGLYDRF